MGTRGVVVLRAGAHVLAKLFFHHDMYLLEGTICQILELIGKVTKIDRFDSYDEFVLRIMMFCCFHHNAEVMELDYELTPVNTWPFIEHIYYLDFDALTLEHHEMNGAHHPPMKFEAFCRYAQTTPFTPFRLVKEESKLSHYMRFVGRRGHTHICFASSDWEYFQDKILKQDIEKQCDDMVCKSIVLKFCRMFLLL